MPTPESGLILGLDLGPTSVGWALIKATRHRDANWAPESLVATGARIFRAGVEGALERGQEESRNLKRRQARQARRQTDRRRRRLKSVFYTLQEAGLLPPYTEEELKLKEPIRRDQVLKALDRALSHSLEPTGIEAKHQFHLAWPFPLRAMALDKPLEPFALGRALYHLAQRRGYKSNRKERPAEEEDDSAKNKKRDEDLGKVDSGIQTLSTAMARSGKSTLGAHFAHVASEQERIRGHYTSRAMAHHEFEAIWAAQAPHHPTMLTSPFKEKLQRAIYFQRPLKSAARLVGFCAFAKGKWVHSIQVSGSKKGKLRKVWSGPRRSPMADLEAQRFRLLERVNKLEMALPDGTVRALNANERSKLVSELEKNGDLTFKGIAKLLSTPKGTQFNLSSGGEEKLPGNRTAQRMRKIFGEAWDSMDATLKRQAVLDCLATEKEAVLERLGRTRYGLDEASAKRFSKVQLESAYSAFSRPVILHLLPYLEEGIHLKCAKERLKKEKKDLYGKAEEVVVEDSLPPLQQVMPNLKNPAVARTLTEMRKVVNAIIREFGKPVVIRVELAREMKKPKKVREAISRDQRAQQGNRLKAAKKIADERGITNPSRDDIEKALLWMECKSVCPYSGDTIPFADLFSDHPHFDVEHIIPRSRPPFDNTFSNKTLCRVDINRNEKQNRTPFEAFGGTDRFQEMLSRVKKLDSPFRDIKLRRFCQESLKTEQEFSDRMLSDTQMATKEARDYLSLLYGGYSDGEGLRIQASKGGATALFRAAWKLNGLLGHEEKRADHRHHALDAIVIALTSPGSMAKLSKALSDPRQERKLFERMEAPWEGFRDQVFELLKNTVVSHRVNGKVSGPQHKETWYGHKVQDGKRSQRLSIQNLEPKDLESIRGEAIRKAIQAKLGELGGLEPKVAFKDGQNTPTQVGRRAYMIKRVTINVTGNIVPIGTEPHTRLAESGEIHHLEIYEVEGKKGKSTWEAVVVTLREAYARQQRREAITQREWPEHPERSFVFSLVKGDVLRIPGAVEGQDLFMYRTFHRLNKAIEFSGIADARDKKIIQDTKAWYRKSLKQISELGAEKIRLDPLGRWKVVHD
jgi:CRISPR-associated endonuclease Csn1